MNGFLRVLLACALLNGTADSAAQTPPPTPTRAAGVKVITPEEARAILGKAHFFDMRSPVNYGKGHVKGAVALPYDSKSDNNEAFDSSKDKFDLAKLPADKAAPLVFYSDGPNGWKSFKAAVVAARIGYKDVRWMREGTAGWSARGFPLE